MATKKLVKDKTTLTAYYISGKCSGTGNTSFQVHSSAYASNVSVQDLRDLAELKIRTATYSSSGYPDADLFRANVVINEGAILDNFTFKLMLTDEVDTEYEEYGAMPSLEYTSKIKTVGQDVNIFDKDNVNVIENAFINSETMSIATVAGRRCFYLPCKSNQEYSVLRKKVGQAFALGTTAGLPQAGSTIVDINVKNDEFETIKTSSNANYLVVYYKKKAAEEVDEDILNNIKIVKGTKINGYSPFNCGSANVTVCNKNFFDKNAETIKGTYSGNLNIDNDNDSMTFESTDFKWATVNKIAWLIELPNLEKDIYISTKSIIRPYTNNAGLYYKFVESKNITLPNGAISDIVNISASANGNQVRVTPTTKYLMILLQSQYVDASASTGLPENRSVSVSQLMVSYSNDAEYTIHKGQTFTIDVQQEMLEGDCFEKVNGVWKEKHNWRKIILNGTESCIKSADIQNRFLFDRIHNFTPIDHTRQKCTHSGLNKAWGTTDKSFDVRDNRGAYIKIPDITVEELKAKLAEDYANGTPLTFYFEVEPYYLDCTAEQIAILDEIEKTLHTYKNGTHVYSVDEISPIFNVKYTRDLNAVINNLSQQAIEGGN